MSFLRVASAIINPFGGSQSFVVGAPVEETGVDVQRVKQVGGGSNHSDTAAQCKDLINGNTLTLTLKHFYSNQNFYFNKKTN